MYNEDFEIEVPDYNSLDIEWERLAEPQEDGYDVEKINEMRKLLFGKEVEDIRDGNLFRGRVRLYTGENKYEEAIGLIEADRENDLPLVREVERLIYEHVPYYAKSIEGLIEEYYPLLFSNPDKTRIEARDGGLIGCACGDAGTAWHDKVIMYSSVSNPMGGADGLIHEIWHHRLNCLGIDLMRHTGQLISNPVDELYDSPVRKDIQRPMSAVIQGQYSYIAVTDFYNHMLSDYNLLKNQHGYESLDFGSLYGYVEEIVDRIKGGRETISKHLVPSPGAGEKFFEAYLKYADRVIGETERKLSRLRQ